MRLIDNPHIVSERGASFLEAAIILPVVIVLISNALSGVTYMRNLREIDGLASEVVQFAQGVRFLESGTYTDLSSNANQVFQRKVHAAALTEFQALQSKNQLLLSSSFSIRTSYDPLTATNPLAVTITVRDAGSFPLAIFSGREISITKKGSYST